MFTKQSTIISLTAYYCEVLRLIENSSIIPFTGLSHSDFIFTYLLLCILRSEPIKVLVYIQKFIKNFCTAASFYNTVDS